MLIVVSQGKQQAAPKGPKGASSANQWGGLWSKNGGKVGKKLLPHNFGVV